MHGKWVTVAARVYYVIGLTYYAYHWLVIIGAGGVVLGLFTHAINRNYITFAVAPVSISLIIWGLALWSKKRATEFLSHNPGLHEKLSDSTYTILRDNRYRFSKKLVVYARQGGVDHYKGKFIWSGGGPMVALPNVSAPHHVTLTRQANDFHSVCRVDFERPLRKGEELEFTVAIELEDRNHTAKPFHAHTIYYRTDRLIIRVQLENPPPDLRFYRRQLLASSTADMPIYEERVNIQNPQEELFWEVKNPRIGYRYRVIW
jgi:hypothetical protein